MRILNFCSDTDSCYLYRCQQPYAELKRFGVEITNYCFLAWNPLRSPFSQLCEIVGQHDLVVIQRCYLLTIVETIVKVCNFLGRPVIFETDDNYVDLIPSNPAYFAICDNQPLFSKFYELSKSGNNEEAQKLVPELMASRARGLEGYKRLLSMVDWVTVSTEELARSIYPYNKNVVVFQNNIEKLYPWRDSISINGCLEKIEGEEDKVRIRIPNTLGLVTIPDYDQIDEKTIRKVPRIGYTGTPSHIGEDFDTIKNALNKFHSDHIMKNDHFLVMYGDPYFYQAIEDKTNTYYVQYTFPHEKYLFNLRNIDIGLAPLFPMPFNLAKSPIKAMEMAAWKIPCLLPNFVTYTRLFTNEVNCLTYNNEQEFIDQLERLVNSYELREKLGQAAFELVRDKCLEKDHAERRFKFYLDIINDKKRLQVFTPNKEPINAT